MDAGDAPSVGEQILGRADPGGMGADLHDGRAQLIVQPRGLAGPGNQ